MEPHRADNRGSLLRPAYMTRLGSGTLRAAYPPGSPRKWKTASARRAATFRSSVSRYRPGAVRLRRQGKRHLPEAQERKRRFVVEVARRVWSD